MTRRYRRWLPWVMALSDIIVILLAFAVAYWIRYRLQWFRAVDPAYDAPLSQYVPLGIVLTIVLLMAYRGGGLYDPQRLRSCAHFPSGATASGAGTSSAPPPSPAAVVPPSTRRGNAYRKSSPKTVEQAATRVAALATTKPARALDAGQPSRTT